MGIIRLLLALAVVITHCQSRDSHYTALRMTSGQQSVQLFYIISGFYMALVLNRKYNWKGSNRAFLLNRVLRLFPTYFVVVALTCAGSGISFWWFGNRFPPLQVWQTYRPFMSAGAAGYLRLIQITPLGQDSAMFLSVATGGHLHFAKRVAATGPGWSFMVVPQAWTLGVELLFYMVAPLIVRRRAAFIATVAGIMLAVRVWAWHWLGLNFDPWTYRFFPFELPLFLTGALAFKLYDAMGSRLDRPAIASGLWVLILLLIMLFQALPERPSIGGLHWSYLVFAGAMPWIFRLTRGWAWERWIGELSYPLYLCHMAVRFFLQAAGVANHFTLICCVASIALAIAIHLAVESPLEKFRNAIGKPKKPENRVAIAQPPPAGIMVAQQT